MDTVRRHVLALLDGGQAYDTFAAVAGEFAPEQRGLVPSGADHSAWQIVEHMRIALRDILDFSTNDDGHYRELNWPSDYWPSSSEGDWDAAILDYWAALEEMKAVVANDENDLLKPFPWGGGQTLLREALLVADHAAYHVGQLVELKRWLDATASMKVEQKA